MAVIECPHCGASVQAEDPATVRSGHSHSSGAAREWIMREAGDEIHRCSDMAA
jgi:hypothetical protein